MTALSDSVEMWSTGFMDLQLTGRRALITGSNSGIGAAIAEALAREGVDVVINGRNVERCEATAARIAELGVKTAVAVGDLSTDEGAAAVAEAALAAFGEIDILVNNAGGAEAKDPSWFGTTTAEWAQTYSANTLAAVRLVHALVPGMRERGWGRVINIGTAAGTTPTTGQPDYGPSKAAMLNMSLALSKVLSGSGVTSNVVSPGMIRTEGVESFLSNFAKKRGWDDIEEAAQYVLKGTGQTVGRMGQVADIAYPVLMLASPNADFINGTNFHIDGGISPSIH
ncbi:MAG: 3-oxoacyl-ACP reductase [Aeromicrobium sp.]|nr:3-oxoacyl-ACP reductase [Aeromicrobium sp.]